MSIFDRLLGSVRKPTGKPEAPPVPPAAPVERRQRKRVNARKGTTVLIIDDSPTVVAVLRTAILYAGYYTREALYAEKVPHGHG